jgi:uncharacterized membrane protein YecN with MAPEG domain
MSFLPVKFTLKEDWQDNGNFDKSVRLVQLAGYLIFVLALLFGKVFNDGVHWTEVLGSILVIAGLVWSTGLVAKFEFAEGEKTMYNTIFWVACVLGGMLLIW